MRPALRFKLRSLRNGLANLCLTFEGLVTGGRGFYKREGSFADLVEHNVDWRMSWSNAKHDFGRVVRRYQPYEGP